MKLILQSVINNSMQFEPCVLSIPLYNKQIAWSGTNLPCMYFYYVFCLFLDLQEVILQISLNN